MSVAFDANVLLYAADPGSPFHDRAREVLDDHVGGGRLVYMFWPVLMAFVRISTNPALFKHPLSFAQAAAGVSALLERPNVRSPGENDDFWRELLRTGGEVPLRGNLVTDAHIVALMRAYGVESIVTRDRDFRKFDGVKLIEPFN